MQDVLRITLLLDFYGKLLTRRQYEIMDLHYNSDYSLGEIADHLNITRQGVYDNIKKAKQMLEKLESKLGLLDKHISFKREAEGMMEKLEAIIGQTDDADLKNGLLKLREELDHMAERI
jgi:predicted DNA-binding protein YlxM (UPF0122 family)